MRRYDKLVYFVAPFEFVIRQNTVTDASYMLALIRLHYNGILTLLPRDIISNIVRETGVRRTRSKIC